MKHEIAKQKIYIVRRGDVVVDDDDDDDIVRARRTKLKLLAAYLHVLSFQRTEKTTLFCWNRKTQQTLSE